MSKFEVPGVPGVTTHQISPLRDARSVPAPALKLWQNTNPYVMATGKIEQAIIEKDPAYLDDAGELFTDCLKFPFTEVRAQTFLDTMPYYRAMAEWRAPSHTELTQVHRDSRRSLQTASEETLKLGKWTIAKRRGIKNPFQVNALYDTNVGAFGEALTGYLSLHNSLYGKGDLLVQSTHRQECSQDSVIKSVGNYNHDLHSVNPFDPDARGIVGVKTFEDNIRKNGNSRAPQLFLLEVATGSLARAYGTSTSRLKGRLTLRETIEIVLSAETPRPGSEGTVRTRDYLARELQNTVERGKAVVATALAA